MKTKIDFKYNKDTIKKLIGHANCIKIYYGRDMQIICLTNDIFWYDNTFIDVKSNLFIFYDDIDLIVAIQ